MGGEAKQQQADRQEGGNYGLKLAKWVHETSA